MVVVDVDSDSDSDIDINMIGDGIVIDVDVEDSVIDKRHDFMEFYSPPRIVPECTAIGLRSQFSFDVTCGHDFLTYQSRATGFRCINEFKPLMIMLSPPCTMFSQMQNLWNVKKMEENQYQARMKEARCHIDYSMQLAMLQYSASRYFAFEHPARASSWDLECIKRVATLRGVVKVPFDMCMFGKTTPFSKQPIKKRTFIMTNSAVLAHSLQGHCCDGSHLHIPCAGTEQGVLLSKWCQVYPQKLCQTIACAVALM